MYTSYTGYSAAMEDALNSILFNLLKSLSCPNDHIRIIDIVSSGLRRVPYSYYASICQANWRTTLPVLLTDDMNVLTRADKIQMKQFPLWVKEGLQMVHSYTEEVRHTSSNGYVYARSNIQKELECVDKILSYADSM